MERSIKSVNLLQTDNYQYLYNQIIKASRSKMPNNTSKWALVSAFDGKNSLEDSTLKKIVISHNFQTYERHRALFFFNELDEKGIDLYADDDLLRGYVMVARYLGCRVRDIGDWKPKSYNRYRIFSELVRHLFAHFTIPAFMDSAFFDMNPLYARWFIHLAQGGSVRKLPNSPVKLTSKMAHQFVHTPSQYSVTEALRYAQVINMGGNEHLVRTILGTRLGQYFENEGFWETVIRFFIQNPMLEHSHIQPIVDYIQHVKFERRTVWNPHNYNELIELEPALPHFTMKGRTVASVLAAVEAWHRAMYTTNGTKTKKEPLFWKPVGIKNFRYREGANDDNHKMYQIEQLVTSPALLHEGRMMHHCVYTYTHACVLGRTSIWSMTLQDGNESKAHLLTIEVSMQSNIIVQIRGKYNRLPTEMELKVVNRWANQERLAISRWVM
jgi:PcfJ-like protein